MKKVFTILFIFASCVGHPQPEPGLRAVDVERLRLSAPDEEEGAMVIAGDVGATPGRGHVLLRRVPATEQIEIPSDENGSFSHQLEGATSGDEVGLIFRNEALIESAEVIVELAPADLEPLEGPQIPGYLPSPDRFGMITVSGQAAEGLVVVATNLAQPSTSSVTVGDDGNFLLDLFADIGDEIALFSLDPSVPGRASPVTIATVPAPVAEDCLSPADDDGDGLTNCDDPDCEDFCRCPDTLTFCSGECVDTLFEPEHCGGCGIQCTDPEPNCVRGVCSR